MEKFWNVDGVEVISGGPVLSQPGENAIERVGDIPDGQLGLTPGYYRKLVAEDGWDRRASRGRARLSLMADSEPSSSGKGGRGFGT
jgi:hypothetical protein